MFYIKVIGKVMKPGLHIRCICRIPRACPLSELQNSHPDVSWWILAFIIRPNCQMFSINVKKVRHCTKKWRFPLRIFSVNVTDQIRSKLRIWLHLLKKFLMQNFIFCCSEACNITIPLNFPHNTKDKIFHYRFLHESHLITRNQ